MRRSTVSALVISFIFLLNPVFTHAQAQVVFASNGSYASADTGADHSAGTTPAESTELVVLVGKITNPAGVLPGAVIILTASKKMAVTNADGEFQFVVPANAGALQAVVTYAGYADEALTLNADASESTVNLANARVIVVSRKQQLKVYLKTARREVKRSLKQVHKATR